MPLVRAERSHRGEVGSQQGPRGAQFLLQRPVGVLDGRHRLGQVRLQAGSGRFPVRVRRRIAHRQVLADDEPLGLGVEDRRPGALEWRVDLVKSLFEPTSERVEPIDQGDDGPSVGRGAFLRGLRGTSLPVRAADVGDGGDVSIEQLLDPASGVAPRATDVVELSRIPFPNLPLGQGHAGSSSTRQSPVAER